MIPYGYDVGCGWLGRDENGKKMLFPTEEECKKYHEEETEEED